MRGIVSFLVSVSVFVGCGTAGSSGGGGGAVQAGTLCTPGSSADVCGYAGSLAAVLHCDSGTKAYAPLSVCPSSAYCYPAANGLTCSAASGTTADTVSGQDSGSTFQDTTTTNGTQAGELCQPGVSPDFVCGQAGPNAAVLQCHSSYKAWVPIWTCDPGATCYFSADGPTCSTTSTESGADTAQQPDTNGTGTSKLSWVIIDGSKNPDCTTNSPGPDIDAIALYRNVGGTWKLMGMAKSGTQIVKAPANPKCLGQNDHDLSNSVCGPLNGTVSATAKDTGYFGLGDRSIYVQIGACSSPTQDLKVCDGTGAVQDIVSGDQLAVCEVDPSYKTACKNDGNDAPQCGYAYAGCTCTTEQYGVGVASSSDGANFLDLGVQTGTDMFIDVKKP